MQTSTGNTSDKGTGVPPQDDRDEDSGLHDIRSMASSAKMRISSKRIATNPPHSGDDDILASSSAGWKAVALPEPAKMVSLPEIDSLPSLEEVKPSSERKSKKELKAERTSASKIAKEAISVETSAAISPAPTAKPAEVSTTPIIGARFAKAQKQKKSKAGIYALVGTGLAAAAGVGWYVSTQMNDDAKSAAPQVAAVSERAESKLAADPAAPAAAPSAGSAAVVTPIEPAPPAAEPTTVATGMAMDEKAAVGGDDGVALDKTKRGQAAKSDKKDHGKAKDDKPADKNAETPKEAPKPTPKDGAKKDNSGGEGEPSFDALLKEAGVQDKKPVKVALEKKSLSGADIKKGMGSVAAKAQACYAGTQGTAQIKLTVNPDGSVQKAAVTGVFAGTPVGACVTSAVKAATFPAWDGGPQTFGYSYLLAE